jgi:hypothetical protein
MRHPGNVPRLIKGKTTTSIFEADLPVRNNDPHEPEKQKRPFGGRFRFSLSWGLAHQKVFDLNFYQSMHKIYTIGL